MLEHGFDLGDQRVVDLQRLDRPERRLGQQRTRGGDRVNRVGLVQTTCPTLRGGALRRDLAAVEPGRHERDRGVCAPPGRALDADLTDTVRGRQFDPGEVAGGGRRERLVIASRWVVEVGL